MSCRHFRVALDAFIDGGRVDLHEPRKRHDTAPLNIDPCMYPVRDVTTETQRLIALHDTLHGPDPSQVFTAASTTRPYQAHHVSGLDLAHAVSSYASIGGIVGSVQATSRSAPKAWSQSMKAVATLRGNLLVCSPSTTTQLPSSDGTIRKPRPFQYSPISGSSRVSRRNWSTANRFQVSKSIFSLR